ncbi:MAG: two-component system response regulator [Sulfuricurvum sp. PD_MW2]|uniref:response regulator transcription factor n=1 Tax=Sulfuricurvum sp. PD_MW2 TaxID=2027917 RepID=UPI000C064579|nr:response regulator transcription factor [Sulfuricurvum sp. PD_MW2]PHM17923.1 MAG: two-component system response regulator [Sulfuricurvum sp. PD_MW2]
MSNKILLLEDDLLFGESIVDVLEEEGFGVVLCRNGQSALDETYKNQFDLYLLDINVPLIDGLSLLKELRRANDLTPTIYLTSHNEIEKLSQAFEIGADDYLKKPFNIDELIVRIHALLRRTKGKSRDCVGTLCIDELHKCILMGDKELELSLKEYQLMGLLIRNAGEIVTKEMIMDTLWSPSEMISDGAIRVYINRLKQEIGSDMIVNIRGVGYRLVS